MRSRVSSWPASIGSQYWKIVRAAPSPIAAMDTAACSPPRRRSAGRTVQSTAETSGANRMTHAAQPSWTASAACAASGKPGRSDIV